MSATGKRTALGDDVNEDTGSTEPVQRCQAAPAEDPPPCNLTELLIDEPDSDHDKATRSFRFRAGGVRNRLQSPVDLVSGRHTVGVTAAAPGQQPRAITVTASAAHQCDGATHPALHAQGAGVSEQTVGQPLALSLHRASRFLDGGFDATAGLSTLFNAAWSMIEEPEVLACEAISCGLPAPDEDVMVERLEARIAVWPADEYKLSLQWPPHKDATLYEHKARRPEDIEGKQNDTKLDQNDGWVTGADLEADERWRSASARRQRTGRRIDETFSPLTSLATGGRSLESIGRHKVDPAEDGWKFELEHKNGDHTRVFKPQELYDTAQFLLSAEQRIEDVSQWLRKAQLGPGVSLSVGCEFLSGAIEGEWKRREFMDDRVFMAYAGAINLKLITLKVGGDIGVKFGGAADAYLTLEGEITGSVDAKVEKADPDRSVRGEIKPMVSGKITGSATGALAWTVKVQGSLELGVQVSLPGFQFFDESGDVLQGEVVVRRDAVVVKFHAEASFLITYDDAWELIEEDPEWARFRPFGRNA